MTAAARLRAARARLSRAWLAAPLLALAAFAAFAGNPQPQRGPPVGDPNAHFYSQSVPTTMVAGQSYAVSVTMTNNATDPTQTWDGGYYLASVNPINNTTWGLSTLQVGTTVAINTQYTFNFTVVAPTTPGTYNFQWRMRFGLGTWFGTSTNNVSVVVTAPNTPPTVSLTAPSNGASYTVGATVPMTATASDSDGTIDHVEFWVDGSLAGSDSVSPYAYNWTATAGSHSVLARAIDNATATTSTSSVTILGVPAVPTLTVPGTSSTGSYSVSWTTSSGATHYELSEQVGAGSWAVIQDTSATSDSLSGKTNGGYSYRVRACAGSGTGNCSAYATIGTITVAIPPAVPTLTVPGTSNTGSYSVSWTTSSGATHYELSEQVGAGSWTVIQDTSATSDSLSGKSSGSYSYKVRACTGSGTGNCSGYSTTQTMTVTLTPVVPTLTVPGTSSTGSYSVSWTTSSGATHYELSEQVGSGSWTVIQDTSATSDSLSGKTDGSYSYRVRACAGSGTGNCSAYATIGTITVTIPPPPPPVPTLTVPSFSSTGSYSASWSTSSGATHYELSEQIGSGSWAVIQDTGATSDSLSGKSNGSYSYKVRACAGSGTGNCSAYSATGTITVAIPPAVPTLTVPSASSTGSYSASWSTSSGATHYELSEQVGAGSWTVIQDTSATSDSLSGKGSGSYSYKVRACTGSGTGNCSGYSATSTITVTIPPAVPTLTVPGTSSTGSYSASWTTSSGATHYELSEQIGAGSWTVIQDTSATSDSLSGKTNGSYSYRVRACTGSGTGNCSGYSATGTITVAIPPAVPTLTVPSTSSTGSYSISWSTSSGATHYELSEQVGAGSWTVIQDTSATSDSLSGKGSGTYGYRVRACTGSGTGNCSGYSATGTITVTLPPGAPTLTVPGISSTGSYSASWSISSGATHYELSEQIGSGSWTVIQDTSATSDSLSGKTNGSYSYKVRACTGSGTGNCSGYSATSTITVAIPPAIPTLTVPGTSSTGSYSASWTASSGATHYELIEKVGSGGWSVIQDTSATSRSLSGKTDGSYSYEVRACTGSGTGNCSGYSAIKTITVTIPPPPVTLTRTYTYDANQRLCSVEEPEAGVTVMGYDDAGNLTWSASGLPSGTACSSDGNTTAINARKAARTYDVRNRVSTLTFPDANGNQSWTYTDDGLPATVTTYNDAGASSVVNSYAYNHRRLLTGESQASGSNTWTVGYGYDANAHLSTLVYPDGQILGYAPNALGQPTQAGSYATGVTYYPNGAIAGFTYGNGIVHSLTQNARGLPDRSQDVNGATALHDDSYDYDPNGNVLAISDGVSGNRGDRDLIYDALNRLTGATSPMFGTATYGYDELDNLTHVTVTGGSQARDQTYVYDQHNRLTNLMAGGASVVGLGYDVQGNLANKSGVAYTFDYGNRLRTGGPETYRYDVQGRRIRSSSSAGLIYSLYARSGQLLFQRDERSSKLRQYIYLGGRLVAESDTALTGGTATVTYQHTDALGTPVAITNSSKTVTERREYEPYGYQTTPVLQDGPNYTGHVADAATGLVYMQQRYMDPLIGQRFLSVDPVTAYSPGGAFNQYWYAKANPYGFTDSDGRDPDPGMDPYRLSSGFVGVRSLGPVDCNECNFAPQSTSPSVDVVVTNQAHEDSDTPNNDGYLVGVVDQSADVFATLKVYEGKWKGLNGKWYSMGWGGNQWTGGRRIATSFAEGARLVSHSFFVFGAGISVGEMYQGATTGNGYAVAKGGLNLGVDAVGTFGGAYGAWGAAMYNLTSAWIDNNQTAYHILVTRPVDGLCFVSGKC